MKRALVYIVAFTSLSAISLVGCTERTEVTVEDKKPDTVVVPAENKDVNVNVRTENPAHPVTQKETTTSTTVDNTNGQTTTEVKTETSH